MSENIQKSSKKKERERRVLIALVEAYLHFGRPVGSQSLQEGECSDMSSATIRNYFVSLETQGYVKQQHTSGGRVPLSKAFAEYATFCLQKIDEEEVEFSLTFPDEGIVPILQHTAEELSQKLSTAVAISSPRFDHDIITSVKFVFLDVRRVLAVITTEFGLVHTNVIVSSVPISQDMLRKADQFAKFRLFQEEVDSEVFDQGELESIRKLYQEALASYFVSYSSVAQEDVWKAGFSRLLQRQELDDSLSCISSLELFENSSALRGLMRESMRTEQIRFWMGDDLKAYVTSEPNCVVIAAPYYVGSKTVGALTLISSMKVQYKTIFRYIKEAARQLSEVLTRSLMRQKISYRMPSSHAVFPSEVERLEFFTTPQLEQL